jgi:glucosamine-6-phosphate deaminase
MMLIRALWSNGARLQAKAPPITSRKLTTSRARYGMALLDNMPGSRFIQEPDSEAVGLKAAGLIAEQLAEKPDSSIVFPTGKTPLPMYRALRHQPELSWRQSRLFHLDEYVRPPDATGPLKYETFEAYMRRELWDYIDGKKFYFSHYTADPAAYEQLVRAQDGPDLVILGIGKNGHIAFNEPGSAPDSPGRLIQLTEETINSNFGHSPASASTRTGYPTQAVTLGLKTILAARRLILLATGTGKRLIVQRAFDPTTPPDTTCPASWLKRHPNVTVLTDFSL